MFSFSSVSYRNGAARVALARFCMELVNLRRKCVLSLGVFDMLLSHFSHHSLSFFNSSNSTLLPPPSSIYHVELVVMIQFEKWNHFICSPLWQILLSFILLLNSGRFQTASNRSPSKIKHCEEWADLGKISQTINSNRNSIIMDHPTEVLWCIFSPSNWFVEFGNFDFGSAHAEI